MQRTKFKLSVIMRKRMIDNRWQPEVWEPLAVLPEDVTDASDPTAERMAASDDSEQWLFRNHGFALRAEDAEGYYLNISTQQPRVFVWWELQDGLGVPQRISINYNEACTWMDAGEQVHSVAMPPEIYDAVNGFTREHYRPQPKKRIRPRSFESREQGPRWRQNQT